MKNRMLAAAGLALACAFVMGGVAVASDFYLRRNVSGLKSAYVPDPVPDAFAFAPTLGVALATYVTSDPIILTGLDQPATATLSGASDYSLVINGNDSGQESAAVAVNDSIAIRMLSAGAINTGRTATLTVNGVSADWSLGTTGAPAAFSFAATSNVALGTFTTSAAATLSGFAGSLTATLTGASNYSIVKNGSDTGATSASVAAGDQVAIRMQSAATISTGKTATLSIEGTSASWTLTTTGAPASFSFAATSNVALSTFTTSAAATLSGFAGSQTATLTGASNYSIVKNGSDTGATSTSVAAGDQVAIRMQSAATVSTGKTATLSISGTSASWTLTTTAPPNAFSFTTTSGASLSTYYTSNTVTLAGFTGSLTATLSGASNYTIVKNGSDTGATSTSVTAGNTIAIRMQSSSTVNTTKTATLTIATTSANWLLGTTTALASCQAYKTAGYSSDGTYTVDPDGAGPNPAVSAYCLMTQDGGGWTRLNNNLIGGGVSFNGSDRVVGTINNNNNTCATLTWFTITGVKVSHTNFRAILYRQNGVNQCSGITGTTATYYDSGSNNWVGFGTCNWSNPWAYCSNCTNSSGLPQVWKFEGTAQTSYSYTTACYVEVSGYQWEFFVR